MQNFCVSDEFVWLIERHVDEGEAVSPGTKLLTVMGGDGVIWDVEAIGHGIVAQIEGKKLRRRTFADVANKAIDLNMDDDSDLIRFNAGLGSVYKKGDILCQYPPRNDYNSVKSAGKPHPSTSRSISNAKAEGRLLPTFG